MIEAVHTASRRRLEAASIATPGVFKMRALRWREREAEEAKRNAETREKAAAKWRAS